MDEPADYNIPDAPDPAGGLLTLIKACIMISQLQGITVTCSKWQDRNFRPLPYKTCHTHWTVSRFLDRQTAPSTSCTLHICCMLCTGKATACVPVRVQLLLGVLASP